MPRHASLPLLTTVIFTLGALASVFAQVSSPQSQGSTRGPETLPRTQPPSPAEMKERTELLIANQHANDYAIQEYELVLHELDRSGGSKPRTLEDKTFRVVPTGTGTLRILLRDNGRPTDAASYRRQLQAWKDVLELALRPDDPRARTAYAKWEKKRHDREELVNATRDAYLQKWVGRQTVAGHDCDVIELQPNPNFRPHSMLQEALSHFTAKVWVNHNANQLVRGEAQCMRDISIGGGILGKLYRGGVFSFEQAPVSQNLWLPTRYQYDFTGRKFLFTFEVHQVVESYQYRRVGPPKEAITVVRNEIASGKGLQSDP